MTTIKNSSIKYEPFRNEVKRTTFETEDVYVMTCDLDQRRKRDLGGGHEIVMLPELENDHRVKHPTLGTVIASSKGSQFSVGDKVICKHFTFERGDHSTNEFNEVSGEKHFLVNNFYVMFGIRGEELIPRKGVLLCEPVYGNLTRTDLYLTGDLQGRRRDIAKVLKTWEGCEDFKEGDYVMLTIGGDYEFEFLGNKYIKVDAHYGDVFAITDSEDTHDSAMRKHMKHGKTLMS